MQKTIMIVDDDEALRDNLQDILDEEGYKLVSASTCAQAVDFAARYAPQVALLDLKLPDDSGMNLLTQLKRISPDCICALMTAFADVDSAVKALEMGAFHYLQKPVRPVELINLLQRIFETIQIREEKRLAEERLKESEARFRTIVESAQDAIFLKDDHLRYTLVNPIMKRIYGLRAEDFIGRGDEELFGAKVAERTLESESRVLRGEIVEQEEIRYVAKIQKTFHSIKIPLTDSTGRITGLCGFTRDLTTTRQLEAQLLQAQKMEAIGTLAGGISHDFNNLLQAILGYSQILLMGRNNADPDAVKLREIEKAAQRATDLTKQLLAFGRKVEIKPRPVDVNQVIKQVEKLLKRTIPKMIDIELHLTEPILTVNADPVQLEQVLLNIGVNARDAMPDGGRLIIATANVTPDEVFRKISLREGTADCVLLTITDTGHGMSEEVMEHLFEPFFTTKEVGLGTGLGLAMAYGIIKNHGGHISCQSAPGAGTTFQIHLPAIVAVAPQEADIQEEPIQKGEGETVLVVDDESFLRDLAKDMLSANGYNILAAASGEEALQLYRQEGATIAIILLDLIMPGMGGKNCLAEILKINPAAKVLISSGFTLDEPGKDAILIKAKGFIQKPYNFRNMLGRMREVIVQSN
ncbi:MAG: response regulator [Desulfatitalea sp.]|nr:response regulator [Desulfatitalea sp.]MBI5895009.1 response regulator [Desulfobacterales bacterium]